MVIPKNIEKEHLLKAILKIDKEGIPDYAQSSYYDVIYKSKKYPPKLIVSYANLFANGVIMNRTSFSGGQETASFKLLEENGFIIEKKNKYSNISYFEEVKRFIAQAATTNLKTSHFSKSYLGLTIKVSFGQGNQAIVPWISFLGNGQKTSNGIYPVFLYYKEIQKLILAYGVSATNPAALRWDVDAPSLSDYFKSNNFGEARPYPNSYVYSVYDIKELDEVTINNDLNEIIQIYMQKLVSQTGPNTNATSLDYFRYTSFKKATDSSNYKLDEKLALRFITSLLTKPFVILTGLSGSGKTKLAQAFAKWICADTNQYRIIPVGADWTNREPLLGYPNALENELYIMPDNGALQLVIDAAKPGNENKPYFLILNEMNLSHIERYFADFLSAMESHETIPLHNGSPDWKGVPSFVKLPQNLFIIGTVNIDETTYMFSPKVLDRASVIEFRVSEKEMEEYLDSNHYLNIDILTGLGSNQAADFVNLALDRSIQPVDVKELNMSLLYFFTELKKTGAEFGYRSASEILRFVAVANKIDSDWKMDDIIDAAIMQKLLPKVHGSRKKLESTLLKIGEFCLTDKLPSDIKIETLLNPKEDFIINQSIKYLLSFEKISRMYRNLLNNGFTSYAEA